MNFVHKGGDYEHGFPERCHAMVLRQSGPAPLEFLSNNRQLQKPGPLVLQQGEMKGRAVLGDPVFHYGRAGGILLITS